MNKLCIGALLAALGLLLLTLALSADPLLDLKVTPPLGLGPLVVRITTTVEPSDLNHKLCVDWDSADYSGSSCQTVDGAKFARTTSKVIALTSGEYSFHATLFRSDNHNISSTIVRVHVQ